jgi:hypothetical protein
VGSSYRFASLIATLDALASFNDDGANSWDAVRAVFNDALRSFENPSDEIVEAVARSRAEGSWQEEIRDLDRDIWTALRAYIEQHTRKPIPQEQRDERLVLIMRVYGQN